MNITSNSCQISGQGALSGANINSVLHQSVTEIQFWGNEVYAAIRPGTNDAVILIAPNEHYFHDIESAGYVILGKFKDGKWEATK